MRLGIIAILIIHSSLLFGQSKWDLVGEFKHSDFMYSYTLTLKDSENYETAESSDLGTVKTVGTWTIRGQAIRLTPKKKITMDVHMNKVETIITDAKEEVVVIETKNSLKLQTKDFKLERTTGAFSLPNSVRGKQYELTGKIIGEVQLTPDCGTIAWGTVIEFEIIKFSKSDYKSKSIGLLFTCPEFYKDNFFQVGQTYNVTVADENQAGFGWTIPNQSLLDKYKIGQETLGYQGRPC
jgi:hypothetical protein